MFDIKRLASRVRNGTQQAWMRLSATQRLMVRGIGVSAAMFGLATVVGSAKQVTHQIGQPPTYTGTAVSNAPRGAESDSALGQVELLRLKLARANDVMRFSSRYGIPADLASLVYDVALSEGIDPELAFRLVHLESRFRPRATSSAEAYGLAQVQVGTAKYYLPGVTVEMLYEPETNLRIGFRYLRDLLERYDDVKLALLAYNRGPGRVQQLMGQGRDPSNGYASQLMEGYVGTF